MSVPPQSDKQIWCISYQNRRKIFIAVDKIIQKLRSKTKGTRIVKTILKKKMERNQSACFYVLLYSYSDQDCVVLADG